MKNYTFKLFLIFTFLFVFLTAQQFKAQERSDFINLNYILSKLMSEPAWEINQNLIEEIREQKVDFILTSEDEGRLKKSGANDLLIKTIDENASEKVKEEIVQKVFNSVEGCNKSGLSSKQKEHLIKYGKQFIRVFSNDSEYEPQVKYLKKAIPQLEKVFAEYTQHQELNKLLTESVVKHIESDELKKELAAKFIENRTGSFEQKKTALEAAKEFVEKFGEETEIRDLIDYFKKRISELEQQTNSLP